ncbi:MAG: hypothetical protein ACE5GA_00895, partial [Candidatus Zixiibacteriota bacterium]
MATKGKDYHMLRPIELAVSLALRGAALLCVFFLGAAGAQAEEVIPTNVWNDFYGRSAQFNGAPTPVGSRVEAFDADGVLCGRFVVKDAGQYGFIQTYGDDNRTPLVDEGADVGDPIHFTLNGRDATQLGPESNDWVSFPAIPRQIDLSASGALGFALVEAPADRGAAPLDTVSFRIVFRNTGNVTDFYRLELSSFLGWEIMQPESLLYVEAGLGDQSADFSVIVPGFVLGNISDQISYSLISGLDPALGASGSAMIFVISTAVGEDDPVTPNTYELEQNYPNPFNPSTRIPFS